MDDAKLDTRGNGSPCVDRLLFAVIVQVTNVAGWGCEPDLGERVGGSAYEAHANPARLGLAGSYHPRSPVE